MSAADQSEGLASALPARVAELGNAIVQQAEGTLHRWRHRGLALGTGIGYAIWRRALRPGAAPLERATLVELGRRFEQLLDRDLANVRAGYYPARLLHEFPVFEYLLRIPEALVEMPRVLLRSHLGRHDDLPAEARPERYPSYYRRTFHWQSDGWLSERSARLYDASVEFLFGGAADVMRRMTLPPVVDAVRDLPSPRILDVGCGTGRFLAQLRATLPDARLYGIDMSPYYVRHARRRLAAAGDVSVVTEDAAAMPWADATFDAVTSVFLFHELPPRMRRTVLAEVYRVLKPGGVLALCDSAQLSDSAVIEDALRAFPASYHEPFYEGYLGDDLAQMLIECGYQDAQSETYLVSKVAVARRP